MSQRTVRYPRGKVTAAQELCLQTHKQYLVDEMEGKEVVQTLRSQSILSPNDEEVILGTDGSRHTRQEQNRKLVDTIVIRSSRGFEAFLQALKDTGHDAAHKKLCRSLDDSEGTEDEDDDLAYDPNNVWDETHGHSSGGEDLGSVLERLDHLSGAVEAIKRHMEVLSIRLTNVDSGRQAEIDHLKQELAKAQSEIDRLRGEKEELSELIADRSEQLDEAREKINDLELRLTEMETENNNMQRKFREQTKRLENVQARSKQTNAKLNELDQELQAQKRQHKKELDDHKQHHRRDVDLYKRRLDREVDKRRAMEGTVSELVDHKRANEAALKNMAEKFSTMEEQIQQLQKASGPKPRNPGNRRVVSEVSRSYPCVNGDPGSRGVARADNRKVRLPDVNGRGNNKLMPKTKPK